MPAQPRWTATLSRRVCRVALVAALGLAGPGAWASEPASPAQSATPPPPLQACDAPVTIRAASATDAQVVCAGVQRALAFLARAGLPAPPNTAIDLVEQLPADLAGRAVGCYLRTTQGVLLLSFSAFQAGGQWFGLPADQALYQALAAHEMAHAVVGCQSAGAPVPVAAHEYVAYVVMFGTMPAQLRERLLARFPGTGFDNTLQINLISYVADPLQFAADAWRHYLKRPARAAWLREVIAGGIVQELPTEGP